MSAILTTGLDYLISGADAFHDADPSAADAKSRDDVVHVQPPGAERHHANPTGYGEPARGCT